MAENIDQKRKRSPRPPGWVWLLLMSIWLKKEEKNYMENDFMMLIKYSLKNRTVAYVNMLVCDIKYHSKASTF